MKWTPNPYAIAQLLIGDIDGERRFNEDGAAADKFLRTALVRNERETLSDALSQFHQLALMFDQPAMLGDLLKKQLVDRAVQLYGRESVERVLLHLLPVTDAVFSEFAVLDNAAGTPGVSVGAWYGEANRLSITDASFLDPMQGHVADCYLIAAMIALAWAQPQLLKSRLRRAGYEPPAKKSFEWSFHDRNGIRRNRRKVSARIPITGTWPRYAKSAHPDEYWPALIEKAYVMEMRPLAVDEVEPTPADYQFVSNGSFPHRACQGLVGGHAYIAPLYTPRGKEIFAKTGILGPGVMSKPVMTWTKKSAHTVNSKLWEDTGLFSSHAYAVLGTMRSGHIVLRNPFGVATKRRAGYARGPWDTGEQLVELNKNGVAAITPDLFYNNFDYVGWVDIK